MPLFSTVELSKFKDERVHFISADMKRLNDGGMYIPEFKNGSLQTAPSFLARVCNVIVV